MNIKDYYSGMSRLHMNQTILCIFVFIIVILPCLKITRFFPAVWAGVFVIILALYFFVRHIYFSYMNKYLPNPKKLYNDVSHSLMIISNPLSTYEWNLYKSNGLCRFSISELKGKKKKKMIMNAKRVKMLTIFDHEQHKYWFIGKKHNSIHIYNHEKKLLMEVNKLNRREYVSGLDHYKIKKTVYHYVITKNGEKIMTISEGLMPINIQKIFNASTPIVKFYDHVEHEEQFFCLALYFK